VTRRAYRPDRTGSVTLAIALLVIVLALVVWFLFTGDNGAGPDATPFPPAQETPEMPAETPPEGEEPTETPPEGEEPAETPPEGEEPAETPEAS
jgi:hypothetical protein